MAATTTDDEAGGPVPPPPRRRGRGPRLCRRCNTPGTETDPLSLQNLHLACASAEVRDSITWQTLWRHRFEPGWRDQVEKLLVRAGGGGVPHPSLIEAHQQSA